MSKKVIVFAGTTEGKEIVSFLCDQQIHTIACVATEYGETLLGVSKFLTTLAGRMNEQQMHELFQEKAPDMVVDATHPFATEVSKNIKSAARKAGISYLRLLRNADKMESVDTEETSEYLTFQSEDEVCAYLNTTEGNVFLTTGSKNLLAFTKIKDFKNRIYARVLSLPEVVASCDELGIHGKHLIAMQGPFSLEMNYVMFKDVNATYMVTKESGENSGFAEKINAAKKAGVIPLVIKRPKETGYSLEETKEKLLQLTSTTIDSYLPSVKIVAVGIGMGNEETLTIQAKEELLKSDYLLGAKRIVESVVDTKAQKIYAITADELQIEISKRISEFLQSKQNPSSKLENDKNKLHITVAFSGDSGFFSGAKKLGEKLADLKNQWEDRFHFDYAVLPGISSISYFASKVNLSWEDATIRSLHGREDNLLAEIIRNEKVFSLFGKTDAISKISKELTKKGFGDVLVYIGENLSYLDEKVTMKYAYELTEYENESLCVAFFVNQKASDFILTQGMADTVFLRGKVPMTKQEIRAIAISKLQLTQNAIFYDIGAGTGSIAIEVERLLLKGNVYAIEKKADAIDLLKENQQKFMAHRMHIIEGNAPEALLPLESPTHAFIGGSSGNLREILQVLFSKNEKVRVVVTAISLETIAEMMNLLKEFQINNPDISYVSVSKSKEVGSYHMMLGQNPVAIFSFQKEDKV